MTPKGGKREGAGRKPALSVGTRKHFYLAPDLVQWWDTLPERGRSEVVNKAIRAQLQNCTDEQLQSYQEDKMSHKQTITIVPTQNANGKYTLKDGDGNETQEGYEYDTREQAQAAAQQLWPSNSVWNGRPTRNGWKIDAY